MRPFLAGVGYEVPRSFVRISHGETIDCVVGSASAGGVGRGNRNVTEEVVSGPRCDLQALVGMEAAAVMIMVTQRIPLMGMHMVVPWYGQRVKVRARTVLQKRKMSEF